jgi:hypothetical protein
MNKLQTVYIPVSDLNSSELIVCNEGIENSCLDRVKIVEAYVFTPEELKQVLSHAFVAGENYYEAGEWHEDYVGEITQPNKEVYIENLLNK